MRGKRGHDPRAAAARERLQKRRDDLRTGVEPFVKNVGPELVAMINNLRLSQPFAQESVENIHHIDFNGDTLNITKDKRLESELINNLTGGGVRAVRIASVGDMHTFMYQIAGKGDSYRCTVGILLASFVKKYSGAKAAYVGVGEHLARTMAADELGAAARERTASEFDALLREPVVPPTEAAPVGVMGGPPGPPPPAVRPPPFAILSTPPSLSSMGAPRLSSGGPPSSAPTGRRRRRKPGRRRR